MTCHQHPRGRFTFIAGLAVFGFCFGSDFAFGQPGKDKDQAAAKILSAAQDALQGKDYPAAATRFREFLAKHAAHKDAPAARYGLAMALLHGPQKNYPEIHDLLQAASAARAPDHAQVLFQLGMVLRRLGMDDLTIADAKPNEAVPRRTSARQRFEQARQRFAQAQAEFLAYEKKAPQRTNDAAIGEIRARCRQAEMLLRLDKAKKALELTAGFLDEAVSNPHRDHGRYLHGYAAFLLKDFAAAGKTLNMLAPFGDSFGIHARYLLARVHHLGGEREQARVHYQGVLDDYARNQKTAAALLAQPQGAPEDPWQREVLLALAKNPAPDEVTRSRFYLAVLLKDDGHLADARQALADFLKLHPSSPLSTDAEVRLGICLAQEKDLPAAIKTLTPLIDKDRRLSDQVLLWLARAQAGSAPDQLKDGAGHQKALLQALGTYRQAADRAQQIAPGDPEARIRRGEILLEVARLQEALQQFKDAAATCFQVQKEKLLPDREEEIILLQATALHLAGEYNESDKRCARFVQRFPKSKLIADVLFRQAENSYFRTLAGEKSLKPNEIDKLYDDTIKRYQTIIDSHPEHPRINLARYAMAVTYHRKHDRERAIEILTQIPQDQRNGPLAEASLLLADCLLNQAAVEKSPGKRRESLEAAARSLKHFVEAEAAAPRTVEGLLKLGACRQQIAAVLEEPAERVKNITDARSAYDAIVTGFPKDKLVSQAVVERARCMARLNDTAGAVADLQKFTDALKNTEAAPLGLIELARLLRDQKKPEEAAAVLGKGRQQQEPILTKDPQRAGDLAQLRYHHGLALRDAGKLAEARSVFDQVFKQSGHRPEAVEAVLRLGECLKQEAEQKLDSAGKNLAAAKKPEDTAAADKLLTEGYKLLTDDAQFLEAQAEQWKKANPKGDGPNPAGRARMFYDAAWAYRLVSARDLEIARAARLLELQKKLGPSAKISAGEIPLSGLPLQNSEQKSRAMYKALIDSFSDLPLANEARFELADLHVARHEYDDAVKLLSDGLHRESPPDLLEQIRLRLGEVYAARGDRASALAQFNAVALNAQSPLLPQALYRSGEYFMQDKQWPEAIKRLARFRDQESLRNIPGLTDRALSRLGQAYGRVQNWDESRQAHERLLKTFSTSSLVDDARYGIGLAWQEQKQYEKAIDAYTQIVAASAPLLAARAQLQIGLCHLAQKHHSQAVAALLLVPLTCDDPDLGAAALLEAAGALTAMNQKHQAGRLLERLQRDYPASAWAEKARELLQELK